MKFDQKAVRLINWEDLDGKTIRIQIIDKHVFGFTTDATYLIEEIGNTQKDMKFKPEDFASIRAYLYNSETGVETEIPILEKAAAIANAKLKEMLEDAEQVFGHYTPMGDIWQRNVSPGSDKKARIVCVEDYCQKPHSL